MLLSAGDKKRSRFNDALVILFSGSKVIAEYDNGAVVGSPTREYIYSAGSELLAKIEAGATSYYHPDHLSVRLTTNSAGVVLGQQGHFPFGESWYNASNNKFLFTTYERDAESGNDFAMARYHISRLGRFSSPDPLAGSIDNPQWLNRYAYGLNDPVRFIDPSGTTVCNAEGKHCHDEVTVDGGGGGGTMAVPAGT